MRYFLVSIAVLLIALPQRGTAQTLSLFQVDTAAAWVGDVHHFTSVTLTEDKIIHSYLSRKLYGTTAASYGDVQTNVYTTGGRLLGQAASTGDSLFITKTLARPGGGLIILGRTFSHFAFYDLDTVVAGSEEQQSFILQLDAGNRAISYSTFAPINDMALDEDNRILYLTAQYEYEKANLLAYHLMDATTDTLATIDGARFNARVLTTKDYIYVAGSTISFGVMINGHNHPTSFPYGNFLIRFHKSGVPGWVRFIEDITTPHIDLAVAPEQGVYMAADLHIPLTLGTHALLGPNSGSDFLLARIDSAANILWATEAPNTTICGYNLGNGFSMGSDSAFNVYLAGCAQRLLTWNDSVIVGRDTHIIIPAILMYNSTGQLVNHVIASDGEAGSFLSIDVAGNGDFAVAGKMSNSLTFSGITRRITDGGYHPYFLYFRHSPAPVSLGGTPGTATYTVYPNPLPRNGTLSIHTGANAPSHYELLNTGGRQVLHGNLTVPETQISCSGLMPGIYYLKVAGAPLKKLIVQ